MKNILYDLSKIRRPEKPPTLILRDRNMQVCAAFAALANKEKDATSFTQIVLPRWPKASCWAAGAPKTFSRPSKPPLHLCLSDYSQQYNASYSTSQGETHDGFTISCLQFSLQKMLWLALMAVNSSLENISRGPAKITRFAAFSLETSGDE